MSVSPHQNRSPKHVQMAPVMSSQNVFISLACPQSETLDILVLYGDFNKGDLVEELDTRMPHRAALPKMAPTSQSMSHQPQKLTKWHATLVLIVDPHSYSSYCVYSGGTRFLVIMVASWSHTLLKHLSPATNTIPASI